MEARNLSTLISREKLQEKIDEVALEIEAHYREKVTPERPLVILCVLKGAFIFCADLVRKLKVPVQIEFIQLASYGHSTTTSGKITLKQETCPPPRSSHILIVEDIVDTGLTVDYLQDYLKRFDPCSVEVAAMLNKPSRRQVDVKARFVAFTIGDQFVVGSGLDLAERYRELPFLAGLGSYDESKDIHGQNTDPDEGILSH